MDPVLLTALRLSSAGFGWSPDQVLRMPVDLVLGAMEYVQFKSDYETTFAEINKNETR